ncbi:MAG: hypothetical protein HC933_01865 [Pleurocapsa sp. SU_196_0]|nr:hypothetical protein [Pleurocapsa sp. SU_196_0]
MIANMSEVLVLGRKRDALEVVRALQDVGVVQLDPIEPTELPKAVLVGADAERKAKLERLVARAETALAAMNAQHLEPGSLRGVDVEAMLESVGHRADVLNQERTDLAAELGAIGNFGSLARASGNSAARSVRVVASQCWVLFRGQRRQGQTREEPQRCRDFL